MTKPKPKKKAKRNPADLTGRNNDARKKEIDLLRLRVIRLEQWVLMFGVNSGLVNHIDPDKVIK